MSHIQPKYIQRVLFKSLFKLILQFLFCKIKFAFGNKRTTASFCSRHCFTFSGPQDPASSQFPDAKVFQKKINSANTAAAKKNYLRYLTSSVLIW